MLAAALCAKAVRAFDAGGFEYVVIAAAVVLWAVALVYLVQAVRSPTEAPRERQARSL